MNPDSNKIYGIVGGLGAEASAKLYLGIVKDTFNYNKTQFPAVCLWNVPITKEDDDELMLTGEDKSSNVFNLLKDGIERLIKSGANVIGIACNTIHYLVVKLPKYDITLIDIVHATIEKVLSFGIKNVGVLATKCTKKSGLYTNPLNKVGVNAIYPNDEDQEEVSSVIDEVIFKGPNDQLKKRLIEVIKRMKVKAVILGCTELPLVLQNGECEEVIIIDSLNALKEAMLNYELPNKS